MNGCLTAAGFTGGGRVRDRGSVLIIVLWISFGLASLAIYFASAMNFEFRGADNRVAALEAGLAIEGAARYVSNLLTTVTTPGTLPDPASYVSEQVALGDASFWFIGRDTNSLENGPTEMTFGLVDEAAKLNLNTVTTNMLLNLPLPNMTLDLALAIVNWRDANINGSADGGAVDTDYQMLNPAYHCKNAPFESIEELRLVYGMDLETLFGEDANLNGVMDPNENDGDQSPPQDDSNGKLDPGLLEYVTVWTREPNSGLTNVNDAASLRPLLEEMLGSDRATQIIAAAQLSPTTTNGSSAPPIRSSTQRAYGSALDFFLASGMSSQEFAQIADYIVASTNNEPYTEGLININTASETVLGCIPGIGTNNASAVVAYRQSNGGGSVAWLVDAIGPEAARQAAPYVTSHSYQVCADIAALGHHGRGYKRMKYIFDTSDGGANILYRQDLTHLGWALGKDVRNKLLLTQN